MTSILIADGHPLARHGVRRFLQRTSGFLISGEANDTPNTIALVRSVPARVIVLNLSIPGCACVELIKRIKLERPTLRILVVTMHAEQQHAVQSFKAGAAGYLAKERASAELVEAVTKVAAGGFYVSLSVGP